MNHYIAVKKHTDDRDEKNVDCVLIIHMKELPPLPKDNRQEELNDDDNDEQIQTSRLNPGMTENKKEDIRNTLYNLRNNQQYNNMPDVNERNKVEEDEIIDTPNTSVPITSKNTQSSFMNSYFFLGVIFLGIFAYIFYIKKIKKH